MTILMTGDLKLERDAELAIVELPSRLTLGCGLRACMKELAQTGVKSMLVDFSKVTEIDSSGLGELIAGHASMTRAGGQTLLLNLNHGAKELLRTTRLTTVFPTYDGAASIVRSVLANHQPDIRPKSKRDSEQFMSSEVHIG
jgi:anti-anti-sigma factor